MPRRHTTIELDEQLFAALSRVSADNGVAPDDLLEEALRRYFGLRGLAVMDELATSRDSGGPRVTDEEAMELAVAEIRAHRLERPTLGASPGE